MAVDDAAACDLRIRNCLAHGAPPRCRYMPALQDFLPFVGVAGLEYSSQPRVLAGMVLLTLVVGPLDQVGPLQPRPQPPLLAQIAGPDHQQAILGVVGAVGG